MVEFVTVAAESEIPRGEMKGVKVHGLDVLVVNLDGKYFAIGNVCTHDDCFLSDGELVGDRVVCICHFGEFDVRTGRVVSGPPSRPAPTFDVRVIDGKIQVKV